MAEQPLNASTSSNINGVNASAASATSFEAQRAAIVSEIAVNLDHVLQNINALNRSLEGIIAVGSEFSAVEALWSQFETVMTGREPVYAEEEEVVEEETHEESQSEVQ